ncbi:hypothetical protein ACFQHV_21665 [Promicromonospora thailandica]|uniref:Secreted protein n=1 Tax=Promicromonospora thailandica TaxID=765201 RepID=A0A9X2FXK0_9MICO|nr:hypothetical protein [Promicromonospora thailandica]MCP2263185.1 hypothetical protein [Promicromonospora thailandica]BFF18571.1 hypothetical protein GCM10025730_20920 [Promicromonospora thailandica]
MIRGFRAISRAVATVAVSAGLVCAATTGASATVATEGDVPAVHQLTISEPAPEVVAEVPAEAEDPVPDVPVPDVPVPDVPVPDLPVPVPTPGLLDGLLAAIGNLLASLLGGVPVPLPVPGV